MHKIVLDMMFGESNALYGVGKLFLRPKKPVEVEGHKLNMALVYGKTVQETYGESVEQLYQGDLLQLLLPAPKQQG